MGARLIIADVFDGLASLEPASCDLILSSPPFLSVRSYLPADHPDKAKEIGSEATPADYLDTLLDVTEACGRVLAPHGSLAFELGDTYAGGGGWGDYPDAKNSQRNDFDTVRGGHRVAAKAGGWPLAKSLCGIPTLFAWSLAYGRNLLRPERTTPPWRIRTLKAWIRTNPPVGALGDKERPATSYIVVATKAKDRWFDLDAVRTPITSDGGGSGIAAVDGGRRMGHRFADRQTHAAGAPPLDWWCHVDAVLDAELARRAGKPVSSARATLDTAGAQARAAQGGRPRIGPQVASEQTGATGAHLRRALQAAGILQLAEAIDQSPGGYAGAHYAVWPPELVAQLIAEMCPRQVCRQCGQPRRRITETANLIDGKPADEFPSDHHPLRRSGWSEFSQNPHAKGMQAKLHINNNRLTQDRRTLGWSDCGHGDWRPGLVLDPFVGSGTTMAVAAFADPPRDAIGIDIDARNVELARGRLGMFLEEQPVIADAGPLP